MSGERRGLLLSLLLAGAVAGCGGGGGGGTGNAPEARDGTLSVTEDVAKNGTLSATNPNGGTLTFQIVANGSKGTAVITGVNTGAFTYTPLPDATGGDSFTFKVNDGTSDSNVATVAVAITNVNDAPVAAADGAYAVAEGGTLVIAAPGLLQNDTDADGDPLMAVTPPASLPANGALTLNADGSFTYVHNGTSTTGDSFQYRASDGTANSAPALVSLSITPFNDPPVAVDDAGGVTEDDAVTQVSGNLRANDSDEEDARSSLTITQVNGAASSPATGTYGSLAWAANGDYTYTLNNADPDTDGLGVGEQGQDIFTYSLQDSGGATDTAQLVITVTGANDAPVVSGACYTVAYNGVLTTQLTVIDPDVNDTHEFTPAYTANDLQKDESFNLGLDGTFTYDPIDTGRRGRDTFTFEVTDSQSPPVIGVASVIINPQRVMPLGDSITQGKTGSATPADANRIGYRKKLYDDLIAAGYNVNLVGSLMNGSGAGLAVPNDRHQGTPGAFILDIESGIGGWLSTTPADAVLLHIGTNDFNGTAPTAGEVAAILDEIDLWEASNHSLTVVVARIIDRDDPSQGGTQYGTVKTFNDDVQTMVSTRVTSLSDDLYRDSIGNIVDMEGALNYPADMNADGIHPASDGSGGGYEKMAAEWFGALTDGVLAKCP